MEWLANSCYDCMTVDEAYRAHRNNLRFGHEYDAQEPKNLLAFIQQFSMRTLGLLLAAVMPVQIHPVEAWHLRDAMARGSHVVLGSTGCPSRNPRGTIELVTGQAWVPDDEVARWDWLHNPLPPAGERSCHARGQRCRLRGCGQGGVSVSPPYSRVRH